VHLLQTVSRSEDSRVGDDQAENDRRELSSIAEEQSVEISAPGELQ